MTEDEIEALVKRTLCRLHPAGGEALQQDAMEQTIRTQEVRIAALRSSITAMQTTIENLRLTIASLERIVSTQDREIAIWRGTLEHVMDPERTS
jgi:predicted RNase H-like nuclease (RuvC/YqgF family)